MRQFAIQTPVRLKKAARLEKAARLKKHFAIEKTLRASVRSRSVSPQASSLQEDPGIAI